MKGTYGGKRREGNGNSNNGINRNPNANTSSGVFYETEETTKNFNDRLNYLLATSISTEATVTVTTGVKYSGILAACNPEGSNGVDVVLKFPKVIDKGFATSNIDQLASDLKENLVIKGEDVAELQLHDVNFSGEGKVGKEAKEESGQKAEVKAEFKPSSKLAGPATERKIKAEFKTDTDISGANTVIKERELEKWVPDDHETFGMNESLEDSTTSWNQFAVNEEKFGGAPKPKLLYTIPTGQNPTGTSIADHRKEAIYKIAQKYDFLIVEDEPYYFLQMYGKKE